MAGKDTISIAFTLTDDANGLKRLTASAKDFREVMKETVKVSTELQSNFINFAALSTGLRGMSDSLNQVVGTLDNLTAESEEFSKAMKAANTMAANTMAGKGSAGFKQLKGEIADLAKKIPIARDQLANGLYQTISNGVPEDNWIEFLNTSARSAVGGLADINKVVGVTSTLIKNYGLEWDAAADIQDKIQLTAKNGVTSFEQLAQALPRVTGNAATLGVSIDELMGTFATLTGVSGNTAEVSTQLAAIFTALVKPSSEAADMAAKMGIQFDAAAIKAAGGFQNFLSQLDRSIKAYAQANGVLEQEVYSKLFGSAESLRALIPLQGELANKFSDNVANMVNSAGTMDAAYEEMGSTGEATAQKLKNKFAEVTDTLSNVVSGFKPHLTAFSEFSSSAVSIMILSEGVKKLSLQAKKAAKSTSIFGVALKGMIRPCRQVTVGVRSLGVAMQGGVVSARALKIALRGLINATVIGLAITAVVAVINHFVNSADDAAEASKEASREFRDWKKSLTDLSNATEQATAKEISALDKLYKAATNELLSRKERIEAAKELKSTYADTFGNLNTEAILAGKAAQAYDQLKQSIISAATARAAQSKIDRNQGERLDLEIEKNQLTDTAKNASDQISTLEKQLPKLLDESNRAGLSAGAYRGWDKDKNEAANVAYRKYKDAKKQLEELREIEIAAQSRLSEIESRQAEIDKANSKLEKYVEKPVSTKADVNAMPRQQSKNAIGANTKAKAPEGSIAAINEKISTLHTKIDLSIDDASRAELYKELALLEERKLMIEIKYKFPEAPSTPDILPSLNTTLESDVKKVKPVLEDLSDTFDKMGNKSKKSAEDAADAFGDLGSSISGLGNALEIPELNVAGTMAQAIATMVSGYAAATAESASLGPFGWIAFAAAGLAQLTAMVSAVKGLPAFANGGIVSGPTVGLIGEYAGASNNPEVVAPLDKLRSMLNPAGAPVIVGGTLRASGRELICVLANETRISSKSGKRTNIKL